MGKANQGGAYDVPVTCSLCGTRMYVSTDQIGSQVRCPDCHSLTVVTPPPIPLPKKAPKYTGDEYQLRDDDWRRGNEPVYRSMLCLTCSTLLRFPESDLGQPIECPDCGAVSIARATAKTQGRPFEMPSTDDVHLDAEPEPVIEDHREITERVMARAAEDAERRAGDQPFVPPSPLVNGVWRFPFYLKVIPIWIGIAAGTAVVLALFAAINSLTVTTSYESIIAVFVAAIAGISGFSLAGIFLPTLMSIVEFSAEGIDDVPYWPTHDLFDRVRAVMFAAVCVAVASLPGMLVTLSLRRFGVSPQWGLSTTLLLLPIVILSMLDHGSLFVPLSRRVLASLSQFSSAWSLFYAESIVIALAIVLAGLAAWRFSMTSAMTVWVVGGAWYSVFYARLLGRLAWVISDTTLPEDEADEE